jgi:hypothetical protein
MLRATRAQLPNFATGEVARHGRLGVRVGHCTAGGHKVVSFGLAMKFVNCVLFSVDVLTMRSS